MPSFYDWQFCFSDFRDFRDRMGDMIQEFIEVFAVVAKTIVKKVAFSAENHLRLEPPCLNGFDLSMFVLQRSPKKMEQVKQAPLFR